MAALATTPKLTTNCPPAGMDAPHGTVAVAEQDLDPRTMPPALWRRIGYDPTAQPPVLRSIREKCLDCCCKQPSEVRLCPSTGCPLWPYRMGTNPFRAPASEAQREASRRKLAAIHAGTEARSTV